MSVEVFATRRPVARRAGELPCRSSAEDTAWTVMIRACGRTFTSDCRSQQEAIEVAQSLAAEFARQYGRPSW